MAMRTSACDVVIGCDDDGVGGDCDAADDDDDDDDDTDDGRIIS